MRRKAGCEGGCEVGRQAGCKVGSGARSGTGTDWEQSAGSRAFDSQREGGNRPLGRALV